MIHQKILLVDDDDDDQLIFMDALNEITDSVECSIANNGLEGLEFLKKSETIPSLIFLDLNMPLMNGYQFLETIKKENKYRNIPVVIFTTSDNPQDAKHSKQLGANKFFCKTSNFSVLKKTLAEILETKF